MKSIMVLNNSGHTDADIETHLFGEEVESTEAEEGEGERWGGGSPGGGASLSTITLI